MQGAVTPGQTDPLAADARAVLGAFARFQSTFAATVVDHRATSQLEVRIHLAETAVDVARLGENLNLLASLLDLPERVPTIPSSAAAQMAAAAADLRS
jgi:hypothetical protein